MAKPLSSLADERRTYWPRAGPVGGFVPDLGDDRPCGNCGYNLRGLAFNTGCPECGAVWGIDPSVEPIPWNEQQTVGSFLRTVLMVITSPQDLSGHIWKRDMLWMRPARRFRRICVLLATIPVWLVVVSVTARMIGSPGVLLCAPIDFFAVLWWFISLTNDPRGFFKDKGNPVASLRAGGLSYYLAAPLCLSPLHLGILALPLPMAHDDAIVLALALHAALILLQLLLIASAESALLWQLVELPRSGAFAISAGNGILRTIRGAVYVVLIPAVLATMGK